MWVAIIAVLVQNMQDGDMLRFSIRLQQMRLTKFLLKLNSVQTAGENSRR